MLRSDGGRSIFHDFPRARVRPRDFPSPGALLSSCATHKTHTHRSLARALHTQSHRAAALSPEFPSTPPASFRPPSRRKGSSNRSSAPTSTSISCLPRQLRRPSPPFTQSTPLPKPTYLTNGNLQVGLVARASKAILTLDQPRRREKERSCLRAA